MDTKGFEGLMPYFQHTADRATLDASEGLQTFLRPSSGKDAQAGHSGCSTTDGEDEWPQSHLGFDQHGHHLNAASFLDATTGPAPYLYSHSGLTGSRLDDTLPLLHSHLLCAGMPGHLVGLEQQQWALAGPNRADQATATSPRRPPVRSSSSFSGFIMSNFEVDDTDGLKGQGCGALPFDAWEDPPLAALHHLQQVHQGFSMPAGQLMGLDDQPHHDCQDAGLATGRQQGSMQQSHFPGHSMLPFPIGPETSTGHGQPQHRTEHQVYQGERQTLCHLQPLLLRQEPSDSRLKWHVPIGPVQRQSQSSDIEFLPSSLVQSAMQQAFAATEATSDQQSDDSAAKCTSSTGYSHSPPLSPRGKRPCSVRAVAAVRNMPSRRSVSHLAATDARGGGGPDSPEGLDTPENHRDFAARGRGEETVRERAASGLYGLRRLKASPRWDPEAAQLSDDSRSAGEAEEAESGSDTEAMSWARRPAAGGRSNTRRRRRVRAITGDASCSSQFRGVSKHRLTQRWEASLWLEGRQLYLGGFQTELDAARAYDIAALSCKGPHVVTNYPEEAYAQELQETAGCSTDEMIAYVRRKSAAFSRGRSKYRGVSGQAGRWEARIGAYCGRKNVSFGVHEDEESAARQYDRALLIEKGRAAKTNFPLPDYEKEAKEFEDFVVERCGNLTSQAAADMTAKWVLPLSANTASGGPQPVLPKKKGRGGRPRSHAACIILAEDLCKAIKRA